MCEDAPSDNVLNALGPNPVSPQLYQIEADPTNGLVTYHALCPLEGEPEREREREREAI